jgi:small-conductance mechanosensitive channel
MNPWPEWWREVTAWLGMWPSAAALRQVAGLAAVLAAALVVDRYLERYRAAWTGSGSPENQRFRQVLWAAKFPALALLWGAIAVAVFSAAGWPLRTLQRLVNLLWVAIGYALMAKSLVVFLPESQARRLIRWRLLPLAGALGILHVSGVLGVLWTWASQSAFGFAQERVTLASIGLAALVVVGFWLLGRGGKALFLRRILPRTRTDPELARSVAGFLQFAVLLLGIWLAIGTLGVSFSNLTLLISALTVGIGFGLQDVIKNVVGGIILLGEGHIRPTEVLELGGRTGVVERIGIRSTTVRAWDGSQVIVPNADLIAEKVLDMTESRQINVSVGVSCDADPRLAERLLQEIAAAHPDVVQEPEPFVLFENLGTSTFDFTLYCQVADRSLGIRVKSDLRYAIVETFRAHDLEMPYPQHDLHLRSGPWGRIPPASNPATEGGEA